MSSAEELGDEDGFRFWSEEGRDGGRGDGGVVLDVDGTGTRLWSEMMRAMSGIVIAERIISLPAGRARVVRRRSRAERTVRVTRVCWGAHEVSRAGRVVEAGGVRRKRKLERVCRMARHGMSKRLRAWMGRNKDCRWVSQRESRSAMVFC